MESLKPILIIAYHFPPCSLTAHQRAAAWAKSLHLYGYYPIVVTRQWHDSIATIHEAEKPIGKEIVHTKYKNYEVYSLPYKGNMRSRWFAKYGVENRTFVRKALTFFENLLQYSFPFFSTLYPFFKSIDDIIVKHKSIRHCVVTAQPFLLLKLGYYLKKKYNISWIADYRDDWNTSDIYKNPSLIYKLSSLSQPYFEKKWVGTASQILSISPFYTKKISEYNNLQGTTLYNGYNEVDFKNPNPNQCYSEFTILYNGTLLPTQPIEIFINAFKKLIDCNKTNKNIQLLLPGMAVEPAFESRIKKALIGYESYYTITKRIEKSKVIEMQLKSHVLLMVSHANIFGITGSKLFEYMACKRPILVCPYNDNDTTEALLKPSGLGNFCKNEEACFTFLLNKFEQFCASNTIEVNANDAYINQFERTLQTAKLAECLNLL